MSNPNSRKLEWLYIKNRLGTFLMASGRTSPAEASRRRAWTGPTELFGGDSETEATR